MYKKIKVIISLMLALILLVACGKNVVSDNQNKTQEFTDSLGRTFTVSSNIEKVAISGPLAQIMVFSIAPEKLVGIANAFNEEAKSFFKEEYFNIPVLGQLYGGKGELNLETLLAASPEVVIDVGEAKGTAKEDLDKLTSQTGIPFVHITMNLSDIDKSYEMLGKLLHKEKEAKELSDYCVKVLDEAKHIKNKKRVCYSLGKNGLNVIAENSYFSEDIDMIADNVAKIDNPSSKGSGNEIDMEQMLLYNPDYIIFENKNLYDNIPKMKEWQEINAIKNGKYFVVPQIPYNILGFPPSVQKILGLKWLMYILNNDEVECDIRSEFKTFYKLFYHCDISDDDLDNIIGVEE